MESKLQEINNQLVALSPYEINRNNRILDKVLSPLLNNMKQDDCLFRAMYRRTFYGGSYYDGLKVGAPVEFDLDLLMDIPKYAEPQLTESTFPGFVQLETRNLSRWLRQPEAMPAYRNFERLLDDKNINTDKVLRWMEGVVQRSLNNLPLPEDISSIGLSKSGPALTLQIFAENFKMDVDLVPCFVFQGDHWPRGFRPNPVPSTPEFFVVPKKPNGCTSSHHWRLSFQEQERVLINNKAQLKPSLKLMKILRDKHNHKWLASYYVKTVYLHACEEYDQSFWNRNSLNHVFLTMLKKCQQNLEQGNIPYYWKNENNMIKNINRKTLKNANERLAKIIKNIEKHQHDGEKIAELILTPTGYQRLQNGQPTNRKRTARLRSNSAKYNPINSGRRRHFYEAPSVFYWKSNRNLPKESKDYLDFFIFTVCALHILGIHLILKKKSRLGFNLIVLVWMIINWQAVERPDFFTYCKHVSAVLYTISTALSNYNQFDIYLYIYAVTIIAEFIVKPHSIHRKNLYSLALFIFWAFSYTTCFPKNILPRDFTINLFKGNVNLTLTFRNAVNELVASNYFKFFLIQPILDLIFIGNFTLDHYIIVLIAFMFYQFRFILDFDSVLIGGIAFSAGKFVLYLAKEILSFENICATTLLIGAVFCNGNPNNVEENLALTGLVGLGLLGVKGVATVLDKIGWGKCVIATMLTSCVVNCSLEIL